MLLRMREGPYVLRDTVAAGASCGSGTGRRTCRAILPQKGICCLGLELQGHPIFLLLYWLLVFAWQHRWQTPGPTAPPVERSGRFSIGTHCGLSPRARGRDAAKAAETRNAVWSSLSRHRDVAMVFTTSHQTNVPRLAAGRQLPPHERLYPTVFHYILDVLRMETCKR